MQQLPYHQSALARVVTAFAALVVLGAALVVGFAVFLVLLGLAAVAFLSFWLRLRWHRRRGPQHQAPGQPPGGRGDVIEGEYRVEAERTVIRTRDGRGDR